VAGKIWEFFGYRSDDHSPAAVAAATDKEEVMAVTIHYRPISKPAPHFNGGTSSDLAVLEKHFNGLLTKAERRALALAALSIIMAVGWALYRYVV